MVSTSNRCAEHSCAGQNTQQTVFKWLDTVTRFKQIPRLMPGRHLLVFNFFSHVYKTAVVCHLENFLLDTHTRADFCNVYHRNDNPP